MVQICFLWDLVSYQINYVRTHSNNYVRTYSDKLRTYVRTYVRSYVRNLT